MGVAKIAPEVKIANYLKNWEHRQNNIQRDIVKMPGFRGAKGPLVYVIMDGIAVGKYNDAYNAVHMAKTPTLDWLRQNTLYTTLIAHGTAVGLPTDDLIGNSEVGHNAMGAGRWTPQGAVLVNRSIEDSSFFNSQILNETIKFAINNEGAVHIMGLLQRLRSVHSHTDHLKAIIKHAAQMGTKKIFVHGLIDGRDDPEGSAIDTIKDMSAFLSAIESTYSETTAKFASGGGRMKITMDRNLEEPEMVKAGWETHVMGHGRQFASFEEAYEKLKAETPGIQDQNISPFVIASGGNPIGPIKNGDGVFWANYRGDRSLEISRAFTENEFPLFQRAFRPAVSFAGIIAYDMDAGIPPRFIVEPPPIPGTISELLARAGVRSAAVTEGQKYSHLTLFWNGNRANPFDPALETYFKIPSDPVNEFAAKPWMKSKEITDQAVQLMAQQNNRFIRINYPNGDMIAHTGDIAATIKGVEAVDAGLARLMQMADNTGSIVVVSDDHGNADDMAERSKDGAPKIKDGQVVMMKSHTINPAPFMIYAPGLAGNHISLRSDVEGPSLTNVAPTLLNLLGFETPGHMDPSLIKIGH